ncbi:hypothetical protein I8Y06_003323 [Photobacterium damselae]|nr:hypothetical protein [Photobacterium damselae]
MIKHNIIPQNLIQKAVSLAIADVCAKQEEKHSYVNRFIYHYFGTIDIKPVQLKEFIFTDNLSYEQKLDNIDEFIKGNGENIALVDKYFSIKAFPAIKHRIDSRYYDHLELKRSQQLNIEAKSFSDNIVSTEHLIEQLLQIDVDSRSKIQNWVTETSSVLSESEQRSALEKWFDKSINLEHIDLEYFYSFNELYKNYDVGRIAYELSL